MRPTLGLVAALLLLLPTPATAAPGPRFREHLVGFIYPDPTSPTTRKAVLLNLVCFTQLPGGSFCGGTYRCHLAPRLSGFPPPPASMPREERPHQLRA